MEAKKRRESRSINNFFCSYNQDWIVPITALRKSFSNYLLSYFYFILCSPFVALLLS